MITWSRAIELQDDLRQWWRTPFARRVGQAWIKTAENRLGEGEVTLRTLPRSPGPGLPRLAQEAELAAMQRETLEHASLFWVEEQMVDLLSAAAPKMPEQIFRRDDLPCEVGFAVFAKPIPFHDATGVSMPVSAMAWRPVADAETTRNGIVVVHYQEASDVRNRLEMVDDGNWPSLILSHVEVFVFGEPIIPASFPDGLPQYADATEEEKAVQKCTVTVQRKIVLAFWTLIQQPLAVIEQRHPERAIRRRLEKKDSPLAVNTIRVVTLRKIIRRNPETGEKVEVEWSHRWIVSGHWRNARTSRGRRMVWINPYVKGPEDKQIVVKKTVHRWTR